MSTPSADPRLDYKGQTKTQVNADYAGMPGGAQILLKNMTSGAMLDNGIMVLFSGGSGTTAIAIDASIPAGAYCLTALDAAGEELTQTVQFYISHEEAGADTT